MRIWRSSLLTVGVPALCALAVAACGSSTSSTTSPPASGGSSTSSSASSSASTTTASTSAAASGADSAIEAMVPAAIKSKGTVTVAADASYAPNEFIGPDGHTVVGMDADLAKALATVMGLKANVVNATFDTIIPGLTAGKFDMGASSFTDTKAREKVVDFVDYFIAGESFITKASGGTSINTIADICGKTVAVEKGTTEGMDASTQSGKCKSAGKPGVTVLSFSDQNAANLALSSGRAQLGFLDTPVALYQVQKSNGQFKAVGQPYANAPYGLAMPKNGLAKAVLAALQDLMKSGQYHAILAKWNLTAGAIPSSQVKINGATS